jgi:hypothetical protein
MDASTVIAVCATVVAVASVVVSVYEARAARRHYRLSVRPLLELHTSFHPGGTAGLRLVNVGLGPAILTGTDLAVDGRRVGEFDEANVNELRDWLGLDPRPSAVTFARTGFLATDYDRFLLGVDDFDPDVHVHFVHLVRRKLRLEIRYESLYGGMTYSTVHEPAT